MLELVQMQERINLLSANGLPAVENCNLMLSGGEVCHYNGGVNFVKIKERVVGTQGSSVRVAKGWTMSRRKSIRENVAETSAGTLTVTNKRLVGFSPKWSFDKKCSALSSVTCDSGLLALQFGKEQFLLQTNEAPYIERIVKLVYQQSGQSD